MFWFLFKNKKAEEYKERYYSSLNNYFDYLKEQNEKVQNELASTLEKAERDKEEEKLYKMSLEIYPLLKGERYRDKDLIARIERFWNYRTANMDNYPIKKDNIFGFSTDWLTMPCCSWSPLWWELTTNHDWREVIKKWKDAVRKALKKTDIKQSLKKKGK